ncbi:MAG: addiction module toxin RelE [archaeon]
MYSYEVKPNLKRILDKLHKKDKKQCEAILNKIEQVINSGDVEHYKNLRYDLSEFKGVHVASSFVLIFKYDKKNNKISFEDYDHHDRIYSKKR